MCEGDDGPLRLGIEDETVETSESVGSRSRLVFVDPPSARWSASRSAGDGANARMDMDENKLPGSASDAGMLGMLNEEWLWLERLPDGSGGPGAESNAES